MLKEILIVFFSSFLPISELRGSIPLGILVFNLSPVLVYFISVLGNFLVVPPILLFLRYLSEFLMHKVYFFNRLLNYVFSRTRNHHLHKFEKWEHWALLVLVAIPLPFTGAWTGAVAAFLFGVPFKKSLFLILLGLVVAGIIVTGISILGEGAVRGF
jgi:uncharacterized membrane protein